MRTKYGLYGFYLAIRSIYKNDYVKKWKKLFWEEFYINIILFRTFELFVFI